MIKNILLCLTTKLAEIAQLVEHQFPKLKAAGSNPVFRSYRFIMALPPLIEAAVGLFAHTAQALTASAGIRDDP